MIIDRQFPADKVVLCFTVTLNREKRFKEPGKCSQYDKPDTHCNKDEPSPMFHIRCVQFQSFNKVQLGPLNHKGKHKH